MQLLYKVLGRLRIIFYGFSTHFQHDKEIELNNVGIDLVVPAVEKQQERWSFVFKVFGVALLSIS
jgi:hypothetical protein